MEQLLKNNLLLIEKILSNQELISQIEKTANLMSRAVLNKGKIIVFGNGGSASQSEHLVAELIGRFQKERRGIPAISLTNNVATSTSLGNDYSFSQIFSRQIEALGQKEDVAVGLSTSGNSQNVYEAIKTARKMGMITIGLLGKDGGKIKNTADYSIVIPENTVARIQEIHLMIIHYWCEKIENKWTKETF